MENGVCKWLELNFKIQKYCINSIRLFWNCNGKSVSNTFLLTESFVQTIPRRFLALSHSEMARGYGKDSTLNTELLNPRAQLLKCCACSLLRWGLRMYLNVLIIRSSSTDPGTITITNSATFTQSPNLSRAPKRVASPQNSLAERGAGGGSCAASGSLSDSSLLLAAAGLASSAAAAAAAAAAARLCCRAVLSVMGGLFLWGWMLKPLSLELVCGPKGP